MKNSYFNPSISLILLTAVSCGSASFVGTNKKRPVPAQEEPVEIAVTPETADVAEPVPTPQPIPIVDTPAAVPMPQLLRMYVSALKEEALYKNCLNFRAQGASDWTKIVCTKEGAKDLGAIPVVMQPGCNKIEFQVETIAPTYKSQCIKALQADPMASCHYEDSGLINTATPTSQANAFDLTYSESGIYVAFEDMAFAEKNDDDHDDMQVLISGDFDLNLEIKGTSQQCQ